MLYAAYGKFQIAVEPILQHTYLMHIHVCVCNIQIYSAWNVSIAATGTLIGVSPDFGDCIHTVLISVDIINPLRCATAKERQVVCHMA